MKDRVGELATASKGDEKWLKPENLGETGVSMCLQSRAVPTGSIFLLVETGCKPIGGLPTSRPHTARCSFTYPEVLGQESIVKPLKRALVHLFSTKASVSSAGPTKSRPACRNVPRSQSGKLQGAPCGSMPTDDFSKEHV